MPGNPLISVVMANYNNARYLEECFLSLLSQSYDNVEVIIVDDGSSDNSVAVIEKIAAADARVRLIQNEKNFGLVYSLHTAIDQCNGEFILRHDPDDFLADDAILELYRTMVKTGAEIVSGQAVVFGVQKGKTAWPANNEDIQLGLCIESTIHQPCALVKRNVFKTLRYQKVPSEDYDLWIRAAKAGFRFANSTEVVCYYRRHNSNITQLKKEKIFYEHIPQLRKEAVMFFSTLTQEQVYIYTKASSTERLSVHELRQLKDIFLILFPNLHRYSQELKRMISYHWYRIFTLHAGLGWRILIPFYSRYTRHLRVDEIAALHVLSILHVTGESKLFVKLNRLRHVLGIGR